MTHKIRLRLRNDSFSMNFGRHYKFFVDYYFREIGKWTISREEIDEVSKRLIGKLASQPRNSSFFA